MGFQAQHGLGGAARIGARGQCQHIPAQRDAVLLVVRRSNPASPQVRALPQHPLRCKACTHLRGSASPVTTPASPVSTSFSCSIRPPTCDARRDEGQGAGARAGSLREPGARRAAQTRCSPRQPASMPALGAQGRYHVTMSHPSSGIAASQAHLRTHAPTSSACGTSSSRVEARGCAWLSMMTANLPGRQSRRQQIRWQVSGGGTWVGWACEHAGGRAR